MSNGPGFQYALRAEQLAFAPSDQYRAVLQEQRDRELEDYLAPLTVGVAWAPTITQGVALTYTADIAEYVVQGDWVEGYISGTFTSAGTASTAIFFTVPVTPLMAQGACGAASFYDDSAARRYPALTDVVDSSGWKFVMSQTTGSSFTTWFLGTVDFTAAVASGDLFSMSFRYKKA